MNKAKDYAMIAVLAGFAGYLTYNDGIGWIIPALLGVFTAGWIIFNILHGLPKFYNM